MLRQYQIQIHPMKDAHPRRLNKIVVVCLYMLVDSPTSPYPGNSRKQHNISPCFFLWFSQWGFTAAVTTIRVTSFRSQSPCASPRNQANLWVTHACALQCEPNIFFLCVHFEILQSSGALFWSYQMQTLPLAFARLNPLNTRLVVPLHAWPDSIWRVPRSVFVNSINLGQEALQSVNVCIHVNIYHVIKTTAANTVNAAHHGKVNCIAVEFTKAFPYSDFLCSHGMV